MSGFILKGDICYSKSPAELETVRGGYVICEDGISRGVFEEIPERYSGLPVKDYTGCLIFPGLVDLHIHAPQFAFRGTAMDLELIDWLNRYTFPEESKYASEEYARLGYGIFADAMRRSATTRAVIFATRHRKATDILMELMDKTGLVSYVGKINMDRNSIPELQEQGSLDSAFDTFGWINGLQGRYSRTYPILTPRMVPSCSDELMNELREVQQAYDLPVQSHLSENPKECAWVKELCPEAKFYGDAYDRWGLFGGGARTVMAHCVYSGPEEVELMRQRGVYVAHCPTSNMNLSSGIAPARKYMDLGLKMGLGSDVAGGETESMFTAMVDAIKASKMYWRYIDGDSKPLTYAESMWLATRGGGEFFGKVGSFEEGYELDAVVLDDSGARSPLELNIAGRMERAAYLGLDRTGIRAKLVQGREVELS